jgi:hypothetical protein
MDSFEEGSVVILASTIQIGTIIYLGKDAWVLLACGDVWVGNPRELRSPQDQADIDACVFRVERL